MKYGDTVTVTVTISVGSILGTSLRGFYLTDYVPWAYPVIKDTVTLNGANINSRIKRESITNQTNYPGFGLQRWVLETPTAWTENNPINSMSTLIIKYKYVFPRDAPSTTISLPGFSWVAVDPTQGDAGDVFGYEDSPPSLKITGNPATTRITIKAATASSIENGSETPAMAIDNNLTTRWASASTNNEWIVFDLGAAYIIKGVVLVWETASGQTYKIQGSNDAAFGGTPAELYNYTAAACGAKTDSLVITAGGNYRYVRMLGLTRCTAYGYSIYEARIYASSAVSMSTPPTVATAAAALPNPVAGSTTTLSVLGADDGGEPALTYTWATTGTPPAAVSFSANGTNGAKNTVATFTKAGTYSLQATIKDADNQTVTSSVSVTVNQTQTSVTVAPASATVNVNATQQFTANANDQFGLAMSPQPVFTWTVSGGGTINASGLFTAGAAAGGPYTVTATAGSQSGTASVTVTAPNSPPTVATAAAATPSPVTGATTNLSVLGADDGGEAALTYMWATTGTPPASVAFSVNGTNGAKNTVATFTKAGSYGIQVTIKDAQNATVTSPVSVTVNQMQTTVTVAPASATVNINATQQFTANASDQFGAAMSPQPSFAWTASGGGTISVSGLFTAGATAGGPYTVTATAGSQSASASVTVSATVVSTKLTIVSATASSLQGADLAAGYAIDGNAGTRWGSAFTDNEWIMFDLGAAYNVLGVVFVWEAAAGREYRVQASNDPAFGGTPFELYHYVGAAGCGARTDSINVNSGGTMYRYVRMLGVLRCTGWGYSIWEARIYGNTFSVPNNPPTVATVAAATPNPVTGTTTTLSVLGADDGGEAALTYTWATTGTPPAAVSFFTNGTNAAKNTVATFTKAGSYGFQVTIKDAQNATVTSVVSVTVNQTQTTVAVTPASATVNVNATQQFTANANDQFGAAMSPQPSFAWTVSGGGTISASGLFTAGATAGGPYTVTATAGSQSATASVTVTAPNNPPTVATAAAASPNPVTASTSNLSVLGADDGGEAALTYTWSATGPAAVTFGVNGTNAAKNSVATFTKAGSYTVTATIKDAQSASVTSSVTVTVNQTQASVSVSPTSATINTNGTQQFTASAVDQFGATMSPQPTFTWTASGGGTISATGLFTAGATAGGPYTVTAAAGSQNASASVTVTATTLLTKFTIAAATASSVENAGTPASAAIDGDAGTRWSSAFSDPQWIVFDLGSAKTAKVVVLVWETASGKTYKIQGSNDAAFATSTDLLSFTAANCAARTDSLALTTTGSFRYVRMLGSARCTGWGYSIWEARIYGASAPLSAPPVVASPASATPNPVAGSTTTLSVLGADDGGEPALTYTWATTGTPPAAVSFSANGTNAAKNTVATFTKAGTYTLQATITDADGQSVSSSVTVTVSQTQTSVSVTPASATIAISATQQFLASAVDQFGAAMSPQPAFSWAVTGGGTISAAGLFTAGIAAGGPYTVTATAGSQSGTASVTVTATVVSSKLAIANATASSIEGGGAALGPLMAIDNNLTTRWSSGFTNSEWIAFDLGAPRNVTAAVFIWEAAAGQDYKVQASNDPAFAGTPVDLIRKTMTTPCGARTDSLTFSPAGAFRYVRMLGLNRCIGYGYSIFEARLYGY